MPQEPDRSMMELSLQSSCLVGDTDVQQLILSPTGEQKVEAPSAVRVDARDTNVAWHTEPFGGRGEHHALGG